MRRSAAASQADARCQYARFPAEAAGTCALSPLSAGCPADPLDETIYRKYSCYIAEHKRGFMDETRGERFRRLAAARGDRLIREISLLGNLANRKNYEYTPEEVERLFEPIERELREVRAKFDPNTPSSRRVNFE